MALAYHRAGTNRVYNAIWLAHINHKLFSVFECIIDNFLSDIPLLLVFY